eukprot:m.288183 g.288183  ORF g.288183 m.288183 type:complete len:51 (+) comp19956_c0_seq5:80-232(+)
MTTGSLKSVLLEDLLAYYAETSSTCSRCHAKKYRAVLDHRRGIIIFRAHH